MIFDVTIATVVEQHELCPQKSPNLIHMFYVYSDCSTDKLFPFSLPLLGPPCSLRHNNTEIRLMNNPAMASKQSIERKGPRFLILSQKLEMMKLSEESMSKAKIKMKAWPLAPNSQAVNAKEKLVLLLH